MSLQSFETWLFEIPDGPIVCTSSSTRRADTPPIQTSWITTERNAIVRETAHQSRVRLIDLAIQFDTEPLADFREDFHEMLHLRARAYPKAAAAVYRGHRAPAVAGRRRSIEQGEVDRVAHLAIAEVARMQVVAAIVDRQHAGRVLGITQRAVEIDDRVEGAALADPRVDRLPLRLALRGPGADEKGLVLERGQCRTDD